MPTGRYMLAIFILLGLGASAHAQSLELGKIPPAAAPSNFPADFPNLPDAQWGFALGGWGGVCHAADGSATSCAGQCPHARRPVIFVHGNTRDASDWGDLTTACGSALTAGGGVHQAFVARGYCDAQLWALSYNGKAVDLCTSGAPDSPHAANEINVSDVYRFVRAVLKYTGAPQLDVVAHSMGVTIVRRMFYEYPDAATMVKKFVAIDGANHGTSICRGEEHLYYGCDEIAPGSAWLNQMNCAAQTPPPTPAEAGEVSSCTELADQTFGVETLVIHNNDGMGEDFFYLPPDQNSPLLAAAQQQNFPGLAHDQLRFETACNYINFLLDQSESCALTPSTRTSATPLSLSTRAH